MSSLSVLEWKRIRSLTCDGCLMFQGWEVRRVGCPCGSMEFDAVLVNPRTDVDWSIAGCLRDLLGH